MAGGAGRVLRWLVLAILLVLIVPATAAAAEPPPELLWRAPSDRLPGSEAGRFDNPRGIAANQSTGNVYVTDLNNARIDEFTVWGEFVQAWGFGVLDGSSALQSCTAATGCLPGDMGSGPGQLAEPVGIAIDSAGFVYVFDRANERVVKYTANGAYVLEFGSTGTGPGQFSDSAEGNYIAAGPNDELFVGDTDRIQKFNTAGTFEGEIAFEGELEVLSGASVRDLAIDPLSGDLYVTVLADTKIYRIAQSGTLVGTVEDTIPVQGQPQTFPSHPRALAVDSEGNIYVTDSPSEEFGPFEVQKFDAAGNCLICGARFTEPDQSGRGFSVEIRTVGLATSTACGIEGDDLYVDAFSGAGSDPISYLDSYGPPPQDVANCPPPPRPPAISDEYAASVGTTQAALQAEINPRFFIDTTYYVEYGPQECFDSEWQSGCAKTPLPPGSLLTSKVVSRPVKTADVQLQGLNPDQSYYFRFVAQSSGGGPVVGVGGTVGNPGSSGAFHTLPNALPAKTDCGNQAFRVGASSSLADCRAYEMVSPVDKNGGDIATQHSAKGYPAGLDISSLDGNTMTFSSSTAFADAAAGPFVSQYLADREASGWVTRGISPPRAKPIIPVGSTMELDLQFKRFSSDLRESWLMQEVDLPLDGCGVPGFMNLYRRDDSTGSYEALTTAVPPSKEPISYLAEVQGVSADGAIAIFRANDRLLPEAAAISGYQIYSHTKEAGTCGQLRLVSILPNGTPNPGQSTVGSAATGTSNFPFVEGRENLVHNAVSPDASRIYWTAAGEGPGRIYLRLNGNETIPVSTGAATFWTASADGSFAYYVQNEQLYRFGLVAKKSTLIASQVVGLMGASEDGSTVYFASKKDLGGAAVEGQPNVYRAVGTSLTYIATLSASDISPSSSFGPVRQNPVSHVAQVSPNGGYLLFSSTNSLTGHDNVDIDSGLPDTQVYLYEGETDALRCISCNSTGARPSGTVVEGLNGNRVGFASRIPPWKNQFHAPRVISEDGSRILFESYEGLTPRDTNGTLDVYEWERGADSAACQALGAEFYGEEAGGCLSLISDGGIAEDSEIVDSTPDGANVFFKTNASLLPQDPGRIDIYDARVGGGFPIPATPCEDEAQCLQASPSSPPVAAVDKESEGNPSLAQCHRLEKKARKLQSKARKLRRKAKKSTAAKAKKLRKKAGALSKKSLQTGRRAQRCQQGPGGPNR